MTTGNAARGQGDSIKSFLRNEIKNGDPKDVLKRMESTKFGSDLINQQRKLGSGWESIVQAILVGFLDRCDNVGQCKELAESMGIEQENWKCHCGNDNYWFRLYCNRSNCKAPRSDKNVPSFATSMFLNANRGGDMQGGFSGQLENEGWRCANCDKLNRASQMVCINKGCGAEHPQAGVRDKNGQRVWVCRKCSNKNYMSRDVCNMVKCQEPRPESIQISSHYLPNGDWECGKCGNLNYASRTVCNKKSCENPAPSQDELQMQHPWICPKCSNINYAERKDCNRKDCGNPRPMDGGERPAREMPGGEWICSSCDNLNFASRVICNNKRCQKPNSTKRKPGDWICPKCQNVNWSVRTECNMPNCDTTRPQRELENGNWECSCGNFNYGHREACNMSSCSETRPELATEMFVKFNAERAELKKRPRSETEKQENTKKAKLEANEPAGSWVCPACSNLNYPHREVCNKKSCLAKRPASKVTEIDEDNEVISKNSKQGQITEV